jgi:acetyltransferase-like isoleucine patch superfamily enzyme
MKAYIYTTGIKISPFEDDVGLSRIFNKPLETLQREYLEGLGLEVVKIRALGEITEAPGFLIFDHVYAVPELIKKFWTQAEKAGPLSALAVKSCGFTNFTLPIQDAVSETLPSGETAARYRVYFFREIPRSEDVLAAAPSIVLTITEKVLPLPRIERLTQGKEKMEYFLTREFIFHINHWSHILFANMYAIYYYWSHVSVGRLAWYLGGVLRAHSFNKWKILSKFVKKGKGCDIHPSAVIEACILGNNVKIGRNASAFGAVLGDNVELDAGADVIVSVIGEEATIAAGTRIANSVVYPRACIGHFLMQGFVVGSGVLAAPAGFAMDMKAGRNIVVEHQGKRVSTGKKFLGSCIGHNVFLGSGVWLDSGLEIPNGYFIVRDPDQMIRHVPKDLPRGKPLIVRDGALIPIHKRHSKLKDEG